MAILDIDEIPGLVEAEVYPKDLLYKLVDQTLYNTNSVRQILDGFNMLKPCSFSTGVPPFPLRNQLTDSDLVEIGSVRTIIEIKFVKHYIDLILLLLREDVLPKIFSTSDYLKSTLKVFDFKSVHVTNGSIVEAWGCSYKDFYNIKDVLENKSEFSKPVQDRLFKVLLKYSEEFILRTKLEERHYISFAQIEYEESGKPS